MGCVYRDSPQLGPNSVPRARETSLRYVGSRSDAATFGGQWFQLATASGIYREETVTKEVVVIGDGAAWIWNLADEYFPSAIEIVDYMHAKAHLYDVTRHAFGEHPSKAVERWGELTEPFLYAGDTEEGVARIRGLGVGRGRSELTLVLQRDTGSFQKHSHRMQSAAFVAKGYHIGSGVIESACKPVVAQRCKQASMKWSQAGINAGLFWRCLLKNGAWHRFWNQHAKAA